MPSICFFPFQSTLPRGGGRAKRSPVDLTGLRWYNMVAVHIVPYSPAMRLPALSCANRGGRAFVFSLDCAFYNFDVPLQLFKLVTCYKLGERVRRVAVAVVVVEAFIVFAAVCKLNIDR